MDDGSMIRPARKSQGVSQKESAGRIDDDPDRQSNISRLHRPSLETPERIADVDMDFVIEFRNQS